MEKECKGRIVQHNDGHQFMCMSCGKTWDRTRDNPMPDTKHKVK